MMIPPLDAGRADVEQLEHAQVEAYLARFLGCELTVESIAELGGESSGAVALKALGYGRPLMVTYRCNGEEGRLVLRAVRRNGFGRERTSDRVAEMWRDFHTFNRLPRHVEARDLIGVRDDGELESLAHLRELLLLTDYAPGTPYAGDLLRLRDEGTVAPGDVVRTRTLARYLAKIHSLKHSDPLLWRRRLRDLIGHGEGIMGLADSYPQPHPPNNRPAIPMATVESLQAVEVAANRWRWWLKPYVHRLSQVHGDFHPFNILFTEEADSDFHLLDRSRGEWGEPADDVSCLTINYLFFSMQRHGRLAPPFAELYATFWETYLAESGDEELVHVIAPWYAWRALVLASPQWYPTLDDGVRRGLLSFARTVLEDSHFDWQNVNDYLRVGL